MTHEYNNMMTRWAKYIKKKGERRLLILNRNRRPVASVNRAMHVRLGWDPTCHREIQIPSLGGIPFLPSKRRAFRAAIRAALRELSAKGEI